MPIRSNKVLLVSIDEKWCSNVGHLLSSVKGIHILSPQKNLMAAYTLTEEMRPDLVVIEHGFTKLPEFEMFRSLLTMMSISALVTRRRVLGCDYRPGTNAVLDRLLTEIDVSDEPSQAVSQICAALSSCNTNMSAETAITRPISAREPFVLLGASTGGVEALTTILAQYPTHCPPTLIVQHTGEEFGVGLVGLLNKVCQAKVLKASGQMPLLNGTVYLAAGGTKHLSFSSDSRPTAEMLRGQKVTGHIPSINVLFKSAARFSQFCVAGILTGMGKDGVEGLLTLRSAGAKTFAQDEKSSVVYGMPKAAWDVGAAEHQVALKDTTSHILRMVEQIKTEGLERGI